MKKLFISASAAALLIFSGCAKDETGPITGNLEPVEFSTTINNRDHATRVDNDSNWENDHIGIFMIAENAAGSVEGAHASNKKHTTSSTGTFASAAGHEIFFPESGEAVHFVAYHPYAEGVTNMIALDVEDQSSQSALDLMYAITDVAYTTGVVELTFGHEMSKLIFNIKDLDPAATMIGATATLKGFNTEASFDLSDAHLSVTGGTVNDIEGFVRSETKTQTTFEFIVFPYDVTSPVLEIALADGMTVEYKFGGASEVTFAKNRKYTYNLNLKGDGTPEEVGGGADIDPWDDAPEVNDDIEKPGTGKDAHFSFDFSDGEVPSNFTTTGSNIQLAVAGLTRAAGDGGYLHITGTAAANGDGFTIELPKPIDAKNITLTLKGFMTSSALFITFNDDHSKGFPYAGTVSASYNHGAPGAIDYNKATYALMGFTAPNWCKTVMPLDKDNSSYPEITYIGEVSTIHFTTGEGGVFDLYIDEIFSEARDSRTRCRLHQTLHQRG